MSDIATVEAPRKRGRPRKVQDTQQSTPAAEQAPADATKTTGAPISLYVIRDKLSGLFVDEHGKLNNIELARFWLTREQADANRFMGYKPDAEETVEVSVSIRE